MRRRGQEVGVAPTVRRRSLRKVRIHKPDWNVLKKLRNMKMNVFFSLIILYGNILHLSVRPHTHFWL